MFRDKSQSVLVTQNQDANEMLHAGGVKLTDRYFEAVHHSNYDLRDRKPYTAAQKHLITREEAFRGIFYALSGDRDAEFDLVWNMAKIREWCQGMRAQFCLES